MTPLPTTVGAITVFVADLARAKAFYATVFGAPVIFEDAVSTVFRFDNTMVNLLDVSQAPELIGPAPVAPPGSGARLQFTIWVADADAVCADLVERGVTLVNGPIDRPWGQRTATFHDPDGTVWEIAQALEGT